jgi:hypothetical protein
MTIKMAAEYLRKLPGGFLAAPPRGVPPSPPVGYECVPGNPFLFMLVKKPCVYRSQKTIVKSCCGKVSIDFCNLNMSETTRLACSECVTNE